MHHFTRLKEYMSNYDVGIQAYHYTESRYILQASTRLMAPKWDAIKSYLIEINLPLGKGGSKQEVEKFLLDVILLAESL